MATEAARNPLPRLLLGGGWRSPGVLRDELERRIAAVPAGGSIDWVTYYLRDFRLARALAAARRRGVRVTVTVAARPRTAAANREVAAFLASDAGLGRGFRELLLPGFAWRGLRPRLHGKLYCFSHPYPCALIGSFNPSGNLYGDPVRESFSCSCVDREGRDLLPPAAAGSAAAEAAILAEIGDQDRGYNLLVEFTAPRLVRGLVLQARWLQRSRPGWGWRAAFYLNRHLRQDDTEIFFGPRLRPHPVWRLLKELPPGARVRLAASHLRGRGVVSRLLRLPRRGVRLEILADATERRVPTRVVERFRAAGVGVLRVGFNSGLPMHDKFMLIEVPNRGREAGRELVVFGSFNWTTRSYWFNFEIGALSAAPALHHAFAARWRELRAAAGADPFAE